MTPDEIKHAFDQFILTYEDDEIDWSRKRPEAGAAHTWRYDLSSHRYGDARVYWLGLSSTRARLNICWEGKRVVINMDGREKPSRYSIRGEVLDLVEARLRGFL